MNKVKNYFIVLFVVFNIEASWIETPKIEIKNDAFYLESQDGKKNIMGRPIVEDDKKFVLNLFSQEAVHKYFGTGKPWTEKGFDQYLKNKRENRNNGFKMPFDTYILHFLDQQQGYVPIGIAGVYSLQDTLYAIFALDPAYHNKGIAKMMYSFFVKEFPDVVICPIVHPDNKPAIKFLEQVGYAEDSRIFIERYGERIKFKKSDSMSLSNQLDDKDVKQEK